MKRLKNYIQTYLLPTIEEASRKTNTFCRYCGWEFSRQLRSIAKKHEIEITSIIKEPINNLLKYYSN